MISSVSGRISRSAADTTGLAEGTPVVAGAGDQAASAVGNGIVEAGIVSCTIGTSGVVSSFKLTATVSGTAVAYPDEDVYSTTPDTAFRWSSTDLIWIFNINTKNSTAGKTYIYTITLNDGTIVSGTTAKFTSSAAHFHRSANRIIGS